MEAGTPRPLQGTQDVRLGRTCTLTLSQLMGGTCSLNHHTGRHPAPGRPSHRPAPRWDFPLPPQAWAAFPSSHVPAPSVGSRPVDNCVDSVGLDSAAGTGLGSAPHSRPGKPRASVPSPAQSGDKDVASFLHFGHQDSDPSHRGAWCPPPALADRPGRCLQKLGYQVKVWPGRRPGRCHF